MYCCPCVQTQTFIPQYSELLVDSPLLNNSFFNSPLNIISGHRSIKNHSDEDPGYHKYSYLPSFLAATVGPNRN